MKVRPRLAGYRLIRKLSESSSSTVYLAENTLLRQVCAVKIFEANPDNSDGRGLTHNFPLRELETLQSSEHPNLIRLLDFGQTIDTESDFLATEFLDGQDFVTASREASKHQFYSMIIQTCRALDYLSSRRIAHGDLKPQNIMVTLSPSSKSHAPTLKLIDLAYARTPSDSLNVPTMGSPYYVAPEVIRGERHTIASDLYSLGVILYECLAGTPPFTDEKIGSILQKHLEEPPPPMEEASLNELHPLIFQLLAKTPEKRPASPSETMRIVNAVSPVGPFRLQTPETWAAYCRSCPLVGSERQVSEVSRVLLENKNKSARFEPSSILLAGAGGAGKSRFVREAATIARSLGYRTRSFSTTAEIDRSELILAAIEATLEWDSDRPLFIAIDGLTSVAAQGLIRSKTIRSSRQCNLVLLLTVDITATSPNDFDHLTKELQQTGQAIILRLVPLGEAQIHEAIMRTMKLDQVDERIPALLCASSGGNPLMALEVLAASLDQEVIANLGGSLVLRGDPNKIKVPPTVTDRVRKLLDTLSATEFDLVALLAIADDHMTRSDIATLSGFAFIHVSALCESLAQRDIVRGSADADDPRYCVPSGLMRAHALSQVPAEALASTHQKLARWYATVLKDEHSLERAAVNFIAAGMRQDAIPYCREAATRAVARSDYASAERYQRLALEQGPSDLTERAEITFDLARSLFRLGQLGDSWRLLNSGDCDSEIPSPLNARIGIWRARCAKFMGEFANCERAARNALKIAKTCKLTSESIEAMLELGFALCWEDRRKEGQKIVYRAASKARRTRLTSLTGQALGDVASLHWQAGNYQLALNYQRRSRALLRIQGSSQAEATSLFNIGVLLSELGLYSRARSINRQALKIAQSARVKALTANCFINIGETYRAQGRWRSVLWHSRRAEQILNGLEAHLSRLTTDFNIAYAFGRAGHFREALEHLRHKIRISRRLGSTQATCFLLVSWAILLLSTGRFNSAERLTSFASRLAERAGLWGLTLELKSLLALAMSATNDRQGARSLLSNAIHSVQSRAPVDVKMSADIALAQIEQLLHAPWTIVEERLKLVIERARAKKMRWHFASALLILAEGLLTTNSLDDAVNAGQEARDVADLIADRTLYWQASYLLGRAFEQRLQYERALTSYRAAALTIHELAMNLEDETYKIPFLEQPKVREVLERYDRLRGEVGKRARLDLASMNRSEKVSRRMLGALNAIGHKLASILDLNELLAYLLDLSIENVRAERGIIFLRDEANGEMLIECARGMDKESLEEVSSFSSSVIRQVAQGQTLLTVDVGMDPTLSAYKSLVLHEIKSILCVPMRARGKVTGVIYLDTRRAVQLFTDRERAFVESFASQAAIAIENARLFGQISAENVRLRKEVEGRGRFENLVGTSPAMKRLTDTISGLLNSDCGVLIVGESGTGKELVARAIHYNGPRRKKDFVAIDCGALPESLLEAELFGYVRGAFTGADKDRVGLIEQAQGGTLFLDEITNTSLAFQARLLRVLQEHEVRRVGENRPRQVDVRVIAATNSDIMSLVKSGRFRQDLYYRLDVVTIEVPSLRERSEDIPLLVDHFLKSHNEGGKASKRLGTGVLRALSDHNWPGNVRELQNVIQRAVVLAPGNVITVEHLPAVLRETVASTGSGVNGNGRRTGEQLMIEDALRRFRGDKAKAARFIGWNRQKLYRRMKLFSIPSDYGQTV